MLQKHSSCTHVNLKKYRPRYCYTQQAGHSLEGVEDVNTCSSEKVLPGKVGVNIEKTEISAQANVSIHNKH